jgi:hypothetical protein
MTATRRFLQDGLSRANLNEWRQRFIRRDLFMGSAGRCSRCLIPSNVDRRARLAIAVGHLAVVIIVCRSALFSHRPFLQLRLRARCRSRFAWPPST